MDGWLEGGMDGSPSVLLVVLSSICLLLKYPANYRILVLYERSGRGKVLRQEVKKVIKLKSSPDWYPRST